MAFDLSAGYRLEVKFEARQRLVTTGVVKHVSVDWNFAGGLVTLLLRWADAKQGLLHGVVRVKRTEGLHLQILICGLGRMVRICIEFASNSGCLNFKINFK